MTTEASLRPVRGLPRLTPSGAAAAGLYLFFTFISLLQQPGRTTYDTRAELTQRPWDFLRGGFTLWHPESNFGEFQNQSYGYLFPQGTWFVLGDLAGSPDWVTQRLWSALVLVIACEGARRVALSLGFVAPVAVVVGLAYGFSPRMLGTVSVITGESLPGAMLPWVVLPLLLHVAGRLSALKGLILSGAAIVCMGGVNAVENAGSLPLAVILVGWAAATGRASWRFAAGWLGTVVLACLWWVLPLLVLAGYAPPFYEYVESASNTTAIIGWSEAVRGDSHWVAYLVTGDRAWWPAAFALATRPYLVVAAAVIAAAGLFGLCRLRHPARLPLSLALVLGLAALTVAHGGWVGSPISGPVRGLLDEQLQIFRNVHKIDPTVRLPLAIGLGQTVVLLWRWVVGWAPSAPLARALATAIPGALVLSLGQPYLTNDSRTPGWTEIPDYWVQARDYVDRHAEGTRTLVLPGSGFAQNSWGWTLDEPLLVLGGADFVTRSQVPIIPGESIRFLDALDQLTSGGRATDDLGEQLARAGIGHVILRRDLVRGLTGSPHPGGAAVSLAEGGLVSVARFGSSEADAGPAVEVLEVRNRLPAVRTTPVDDVVTVRGGPESVLTAQRLGLVDPGQATVLEGEAGWRRRAAVVTDDDQRRERAFGSTDESVSTLLGPDEPWRIERTRHDYPTVPGQPKVVARYDGLERLLASSAQGYADNFGVLVPESGPYGAFDGDPSTRWISSRATDPGQQWLRAVFDAPRQVHTVSVLPVVDDDQIVPPRVLEVRAGPQTRRLDVNPSGAPVVAEFDGSVVGSIEVRVVRAITASSQAPTGIREVTIDDLESRRTFVVPGAVAEGASFAFGARPERRACNTTIDVPDCSVARIRAAEERAGMDRTFVSAAASLVRFHGTVQPRATPESARLLEPLTDLQVGATSIYGFDPKVSSRFAYDGQVSTAWVSAPQDRSPTLILRWNEPRRVEGIAVLPGEADYVPTAAVVRSGRRVEEVSLTGDVALFDTPIVRRRMEISFVRPLGADRVAVPELRLLGPEIARTLDPETPTGAVCGLGPNIEVNGQVVPTKVEGTLRDVANGSPLRFESCALGDGAGTAALRIGTNRLTTEPTEEFAVLEIAGVPVDATTSASQSSRSVEVSTWDSARRQVRIGAGEESVLFLPENFNAGWRAELDGDPLTPLRVDGWQQAWLVPAGAGGQVTLVYTPQRVYTAVLALGLAVSGAVLLAGLVVLMGLALRPGVRRETRAVSDEGTRGLRVVGWLVCTVATGLFLGGVALAGLVVGAVARSPGEPTGRLRRAAPTGAAATVMMVLLVVSSSVVDVMPGGSWRGTAADMFAVFAVGLLIGLVGAARTHAGESGA